MRPAGVEPNFDLHSEKFGHSGHFLIQNVGHFERFLTKYSIISDITD